MPKLSRRKLANNAANRLIAGEPKKDVLRDVAAYLIDSGRKSEVTLVVRDIEAMLLSKGIAIGTVTSARPLSADALKNVESLVKNHYPAVGTVVLRTEVDERLIGGVKVELPGVQLDASVKAKIMKITA